MLETLRGVTVSRLMTRVVETVPPDISITEFLDAYVLPRHDQTFVVSEGDAALGLIAFGNLTRVPRREWTTRRVREVMVPRANFESLEPEQTAAAALARLSATEQDELPVVEGERVVGFLGQGALARYLKIKPPI
jgi:CBS domain-containing protein